MNLLAELTSGDVAQIWTVFFLCLAGFGVTCVLVYFWWHARDQKIDMMRIQNERHKDDLRAEENRAARIERELRDYEPT